MPTDSGIKLAVEGEKQFKSALADINRELRVSKSEMELLAAKYDSSDKCIEAMTARQKALESQLTKQKGAVETITAALDNAKESFGENDKRTLAWQEALNKAEAEVLKTEKAIEKNNAAMNDMSGEAREGEKAEADMGSAVKKSAEEIAAQEKAAQDARKTLAEYADAAQKKAVMALAALGTAAIGAAKGLTSMVLSSADAANDLGDLAAKTGLSTTALQEYEYAAEQAGTSLETITGAQTKLVSTMTSAASGTGAAAAAFKSLGIEVKDSSGKLRDTDSVFNDVIDALGKIDNETERDAAAMKLFGKSARELNPLIKAGSTQLNAYKSEAHDLGIVVSEETVQALADLSLEQKKTERQFDAFKQNLSAKLAPVISKTFESIQQVFVKLNDSLGDPRINAAIEKLGDALGKFLDKAVDLAVDALPKLVSTAGWLLENFDKLAISIGVIWGIFKTVSVVTKTAEAFHAVKTAVDAFKASTEAAAVASTGLEAAATTSATSILAIVGPIGLAVGAIALLVATAVKKEKEHRKELVETSTEIIDETTRITDSVKKSREEFDKTVGKTEAASGAAKKYIERMRELERRSSLTNVEMAEYNECLSKVKGLLPDINIQIDKQTGFIEGGAGALQQQIDKWREKIKLEAMSNMMTDVLQRQVELQLQVNKAQEDYNTKAAAYNDLQEKIATGYYDLNQLSDNFTESYYAMIDAFGTDNPEDLRIQMEAAKEALEAAEGALRDTTVEADELSGAYTEAAEKAGVFEEATDDATESVDGLAESFEEAGKSADEFAKEHLQKVLDGAQNMFQEIDTGSRTSMQELIKTLKHNKEVINDWDANLAAIYERGASEEFVEYLEGLGLGYADQVDMIAKSTDKNFKKLVKAWEDNTKTAYSSGEEYGKMIGKGVEDGMDSKISSLKKASIRAAKAVANAFTNFMEIKSPSGRMRRESRHIPEGGALGIIDEIPLLEKASVRAANAVEKRFKPRLDIDFDTAMEINKDIGIGLRNGFEGGGARVVNNFYITDPSPEYHEMIMNSVNNGFGGVYA